MSCLQRPNVLLTAPVVPVIAQEAPEKWTAVYIGDSWLPQGTQLYVEQIKNDFGVDAFFTQRGATFVRQANEMLQSGAWNVVADADVVVVSIVTGLS